MIVGKRRARIGRRRDTKTVKYFGFFNGGADIEQPKYPLDLVCRLHSGIATTDAPIRQFNRTDRRLHRTEQTRWPLLKLPNTKCMLFCLFLNTPTVIVLALFEGCILELQPPTRRSGNLVRLTDACIGQKKRGVRY